MLKVEGTAFPHSTFEIIRYCGTAIPNLFLAAITNFWLGGRFVFDKTSRHNNPCAAEHGEAFGVLVADHEGGASAVEIYFFRRDIPRPRVREGRESK